MPAKKLVVNAVQKDIESGVAHILLHSTITKSNDYYTHVTLACHSRIISFKESKKSLLLPHQMAQKPQLSGQGTWTLKL